MQAHRWLRWLPLLVVGLIGLLLVFALPGGRGPEPGAELTAEEARVQHVPRGAAPVPLVVKTPSIAHDGDAIDVDPQGRARLVFPDALIVDVYRNSILVVGLDPQAAPVTRFRLEAGTVFTGLTAEAAARERVQITTENAVITAIGTQFLVHADARRRATWVVVKEGRVRVEAPGQPPVIVTARQQTWVLAGQAPVAPQPAARAAVGPPFPGIEVLTNNRRDDCDLLPLGPTPNPCPVTGPLASPTPSPTRPPVAATTPTPTRGRATATPTLTPTRGRPTGPTATPTMTPTPPLPAVRPPRILRLEPREVVARAVPPARDAVPPPLPLIVIGSGFAPNAQVLWEDDRLPTEFVSETELRVTVAAERLDNGGRFAVQVVNPAPGGPVPSNAVALVVNNPVPTISGIEPDGAAVPLKRPITLRVSGTGFIQNSQVAWNGELKPTRLAFVPSQSPAGLTLTPVLLVELEADDIPAAGAYRLAVINPAPQGGRVEFVYRVPPPVG